MTKMDFKKDLAELYNPPRGQVTFVDVPPLQYLMIDGMGNPNKTPEYQAAVETLYGMSYALKFALKEQGLEYVVGPLQGLWWMEDMAEFSVETKDRWEWTMMILQPAEVTPERIEQAQAGLRRKKKDLPSIDRLRLETYHEGLAAQTLYFGPYADEGPTIARLHAFIKEQGYQLRGKHHEIYLGDPRRTIPEKLKTIIRQPAGK